MLGRAGQPWYSAVFRARASTPYGYTLLLVLKSTGHNTAQVALQREASAPAACATTNPGAAGPEGMPQAQFRSGFRPEPADDTQTGLSLRGHFGSNCR